MITSKVKTVDTPNEVYQSLEVLWAKSRALCSGERYVKELDIIIDKIGFKNILIPFSPSMSQNQYSFYKAEAELPGIVAQFSRMIVGGLLRKQPTLDIPDSFPIEASNWIIQNFGRDGSSLVSFLDNALWEEIQTTRAWVYVDHPKVENTSRLTRADKEKLFPFPVIWPAESVINYRVSQDINGKMILTMVIYRGYQESYEENEFHPTLIDTLWVHELDENGHYRIRVFESSFETNHKTAIAGRELTPRNKNVFIENKEKIVDNILINDKPLTFLPIWPLNGNLDPQEPILSPIIDKEIALYNKMSRRNHLLYGAATYTPIISSDMSDDEFDKIVNAGLGSWIHLGKEESASILDTPTDALADMDRAIAAAIEEMAKLGIRMLTPETAQSGIALEIRNAAQTAQLGTLSTKVSNTMEQVIAFMLNWKYNLNISPAEIHFVLSGDFSPVPIGADWLRLATEWYESGLIPRSSWVMLLKQNDMLEPDYNDEEGKLEINSDEIIVPKGNEDYAGEIEGQM